MTTGVVTCSKHSLRLTMKRYSITDAEWSVMQAIWPRNQSTAAEIIEDVTPTTGWSHRTVRTLLGRLVAKGLLTARQDGHRYVYKPAVTRQRCVREASNSFLDKVFAGDPAELLVHFVQDAELTADEAAQLQALLDEKIKAAKRGSPKKTKRNRNK